MPAAACDAAQILQAVTIIGAIAARAVPSSEVGAGSMLPTRCAQPTIGGTSTYTILGFIGYGVASLVGALLSWHWQLPMRDRVIALLVPPIMFLAVVTVARRVAGREVIVFYQTAIAGVVGTTIVGAAAGAHVARLVDVSTLGIGTFLVFGRIGCFAVACCHGRPARFGVVYGATHVRLGFWARWAGRRLWPVQLVESAASGTFVVIAASVGWAEPGVPASIFIASYGALRFTLEVVRGDAARPHLLGISEAQWAATVTASVVALWRTSPFTVLVAIGLAAATAGRALTRRRRSLTHVRHLREIDRACSELLTAAPGHRHETSHGMSISYHRLPNQAVDWVLSAEHEAWSSTVARRIARDLWPAAEVVEGRLPGVIHIIEHPTVRLDVPRAVSERV